MKRLACLAAVSLATSGAASAQLVQEVRAGGLAHNICVVNCDNANQEDGFNVQGEIVFDRPDFFKYLLKPRPFIVGSVNTAGDTSFGGFGLVWNWDFARKWSLEPSLGYVIHTGELEVPFPIGDPRNLEFDENNILFGSRDLFRTTLALNRDLGDNWGVQVIFEHLSHGQILGDGRNQGNDSLGGRVYYRFGG
ncbi:MAG: acyloxyacyl hydrolase [Pseudomonadota bacterium]